MLLIDPPNFWSLRRPCILEKSSTQEALIRPCTLINFWSKNTEETCLKSIYCKFGIFVSIDVFLLIITWKSLAWKFFKKMDCLKFRSECTEIFYPGRLLGTLEYFCFIVVLCHHKTDKCT